MFQVPPLVQGEGRGGERWVEEGGGVGGEGRGERKNLGMDLCSVSDACFLCV